MSLFGSIQMAKNALRAQQIGLQVVGQNISNANTPGYIREEVIVSPAPTQRIGGLLLGLGVQVDAVVQKIDKFLEERLRNAKSDRVSNETKEQAYLELESILGELGDTDLSTALDTLEDAIRKIDRETRGRFKDTFDRVNSGIQELYPRLFGGGHAYLELTGEDLLDTGVAIMARPPGKRVSNISLLSGGEKALTAVALVFSIFLIKPSPFCILDEVDAPLDEANVDRYNELVREMTDRSQFIVITHNKRTMESVDNLYGVTMKEPGVSMLVSVNLSKLGARANSATSVPSASAAL